MKNITIELSKKDLAILCKHFSQDIGYGVGGTFGDGENWDNKAEFNRANVILRKLEEALGWWK
jgi:hypothetical protein